MRKFLTLIILAASIMGCEGIDPEPGANSSLKISSPALQAPAAGGRFNITVTADCDWTATCSADWVTLSPQTGTAGESIFTATVAANTSTEARSAKITVAAEGGISHSTTIRQDGAKGATVEGGKINIPDSRFQKYLVRKFDTDGDGQISIDEARAVTKMYCSFEDITSLQGIEYFTSLDTLECERNMLTTLDVSKLPQLKYLDCRRNSLTELNVDGCTSLEVLYCNENPFTELDIHDLPQLLHFSCRNCQITKFTISGCKKLGFFDCCENQISTLDVSSCTEMIGLHCSDNRLTELDLSSLTHVAELVCHSNQIPTLDVSMCAAVTLLHGDFLYQCESKGETEEDTEFLPLKLLVNKTQYDKIQKSYAYQYKKYNITIFPK